MSDIVKFAARFEGRPLGETVTVTVGNLLSWAAAAKATPESAKPGFEQSSDELASLAGQVLQDPDATVREKRLAGSVLTQFEKPDDQA